MPVLVVGADSPVGEAIMAALTGRDGEVRAFVSDPQAADLLKRSGVKVALGDVSDASHVGAAALNCFSVVFVTAAATDDRPRAFAESPESVLESWREAMSEAGARRAIWVETPDTAGSGGLLHGVGCELAIVGPDHNSLDELGEQVAALDDLADLPDR